jgi:hypothetical protein
MIVLKILVTLSFWAGVIAAVIALRRFDLRMGVKFGHRFLSIGILTILFLAIGLLRLGHILRVLADSDNGDPLNGILIMVMGGGILIAILFLNYRRAGWIHGTIGTAFQVILAVPVGYVAIRLMNKPGDFLVAPMAVFIFYVMLHVRPGTQVIRIHD